MSALPAYTGSPAMPGNSGTPLVLCPGRAGGVVLQQRAVSAMAAQLDEGFRLAPRGGVEMGGLLIGACAPDGQVVVEEIVPIAIEYKFGPSFRISETDRSAVEKAVESSLRGGAGTVVGMYRSHCRGVLEVRPSDDEFLQLVDMAHAPAVPDLRTFMLLRRQSKIYFSAITHVYDGAEWSSAAEVTIRHGAAPAVIEPPEESAEAEPLAQPLPTLTSVPAGVPEPARLEVIRPSAPVSHAIRLVEECDPAPAITTPEPEAPTTVELLDDSVVSPPSDESPDASTTDAPEVPGSVAGQPSQEPKAFAPDGRRMRLYVAGVAVSVIVGLGGGYGLFSLRKAEQPPAVDRATAGGAQLGFAAVRQSTDWKLTWRRAAVFALEPSGATLTIRDGGTEQQLGLGLDELAIGSIVYTPHSGDVSFSLAVTATGRPAVKERIRVLDPGFVAPAAATATRVGPPARTLHSR